MHPQNKNDQTKNEFYECNYSKTNQTIITKLQNYLARP